MGWQAGDEDGPGDAPDPGEGLPGLLAAFEHGGAWDAAAPSAALAAALETAAGPRGRYDGAGAAALVGITRQWAALESYAAAGGLGSLRATMREDGEGRPLLRRRTDLPDGWGDSLNYEIAGALAMGPVSAGNLARLAWTLGTRLPGIGRLLADGTLTKSKAKLIAATFEPLSEGEAARAEALIVGDLAGKTWYQVERLAWRAALAVAPDLAERRRADAEKRRARVTIFREESGAVGLSGRDLPAAQALSGHANVLARAEQYERSGAFPDHTGSALQALAYLHLLSGVSAQDAIAFARTSAAGPPHPAPPDDDEGDQDPWDEEPRDSAPRDDHPRGEDPDPGDPRDDGSRDDDPSGEDPRGGDPGREADSSADAPGSGQPHGDHDHDDDGDGDGDGDGPASSGGPGGGGPGGGDGPGGGGAPGDGHSQRDDDDGPDGSSGPDSSSGDAPGDGHRHGGDEGPDDDPGDGQDPGGGGDPGGGSGPGGDGGDGGDGGPGGAEGRPVLPEIIAPLATLQRRAERAGDSRLLGPLDPALTRDLAAAAARSPNAQWAITIVDDRGHATGHGTARPRRRRRHQPQPPPGPALCALPARVNIIVTETLLHQLAAQPRPGAPPRPAPPGDWHLAPRTGNAGDNAWILTLPGGRELTARFDVVPTHDCDHRYQANSYQPGERLRRLVQVRDHECTFPPCSRPAHESDFEHAIPYDQGGRTDACNAGARSRRCHQVKQSKGWTVTQPKPGWHVWTTPTGRTYTQEPWRYTA